MHESTHYEIPSNPIPPSCCSLLTLPIQFWGPLSLKSSTGGILDCSGKREISLYGCISLLRQYLWWLQAFLLFLGLCQIALFATFKKEGHIYQPMETRLQNTIYRNQMLLRSSRNAADYTPRPHLKHSRFLKNKKLAECLPAIP